MRKRGALSNDESAEEVISTFLAKGHSATASVIAAFFMAGAEHPATLFGSLVLLVAGTGQGVKVFDGRVRQPGLAHKRPRGFLPGETIPAAARVGAPSSISAAAVALAFEGGKNLAAVVRPAEARAKALGFATRASVLAAISSLGPKAVSHQLVAGGFLRTAGPSEGGLMGNADLVQIKETEFSPEALEGENGTWFRPPLVSKKSRGLNASEPQPSLERPVLALAADTKGELAAACYFKPSSSVALDGLELSAPLLAVPVERGVPRVAPGSRLGASAPVAVLRSPEGVFVRSVAFINPDDAGWKNLEDADLRLLREPSTFAVSALRGKASKARFI